MSHLPKTSHWATDLSILLDMVLGRPWELISELGHRLPHFLWLWHLVDWYLIMKGVMNGQSIVKGSIFSISRSAYRLVDAFENPITGSRSKVAESSAVFLPGWRWALVWQTVLVVASAWLRNHHTCSEIEATPNQFWGSIPNSHSWYDQVMVLIPRQASSD